MKRLGTFAIVLVLLGLLVATVWYAAQSFVSIPGPPMPTSGYVAMILGVFFSLVVGIGLMALLFYSSRHGYDDQASDQSRRTESDSR